ncbi:MAG TPA: hypothetical protein VMD30_05880 [Tepidisphaeraceae bacterium]|nr:hypothetical protein [Tepidisphaeraceae bacterium]
MPANEFHGAGELADLRLRLQAESGDGLKLLSSPQDNPICAIAFDASIPAVSVVWKRYATSIQLRFIHEHILELLQRHGATKMLSDDTALESIHTEDQRWIIKEWLPRALTAGLRATASKAPNSYFARLSVANIQAEAPKSLTIRTFPTLPEARQWLQKFPC